MTTRSTNAGWARLRLVAALGAAAMALTACGEDAV